MDVTIAGDAITYRPDDDQLGTFSLQFAAFDGEVGTGQVPVPDPTAAISYYDGRQFQVQEGSALLTDGWIIDQDRDRGPMPADPARVHTFSVMDANALLDGFRVETTRPSETDRARVLAMAATDLPGVDTTWVVNAELVTLPKKTYSSDGGWTAELISDLVEFTGKTLFIHDKRDGSGRCLHYHNLVSGHTSGLSISDQTSNGPTVWNPWEPRRQRTSVDLRNDVKLTDQSGRTSTATDSTSISRHDADGLRHQTLQNVDANSQSDLDVKAAAMLASLKDERDTFTCTIGPLDETALLGISVGDLITVTSSVMGLSASTQRISHMTLHPWIGESGRVVEGYWLADLEMGAPVRRRRRTSPAVFTDDVWKCEPTDFLLSTEPGTEGLVVIATDPYGTWSSTNHVLLYAGCVYSVEYTCYHHDNASYSLIGALVPTTGPATAIASESFGTTCEAALGHPAVLDVDYWIFRDTTTPTIGATLNYRLDFTGAFAIGCYATGSILGAAVYFVSGPDPRFELLGPCVNGAPRVGQRFDDTAGILGTDDGLGDGTTTDFTLPYPHQGGSLNIFCNGLDWTTDIASQDTATGDFTMAYPFPLGSTVRIIARRAS